MSLQPLFEKGKFVITAEVGPLKGTDTTELMEAVEVLKGKVDAANVTDQQSSVMRLGSLAVCHLLKMKGLEPVLQVTCRDRNRLALQSDLLSAAVLGIENVLSITGDLPVLGDHPEAKPVFDLDSVHLLWAVVNPGADTEAARELQLIKMEKKIEAGARFFQTQAIYDPGAFAKFMRRAGKFGIPILAGIIPLKSAGMAKFMNKNVSGVFVPDELIEKMTAAEDKAKMGVEIAAGLIKELKDMCQGVHIMAIGWEKKVPLVLEAAGI
jgi:methylenetetrahydrofolate reductase (NADPH)